MSTATIGSGMQVEYTMEHRDGTGKLIYREASVMMPQLPPAPDPPTCPDCIELYKKKLDVWAAYCKDKMDDFKAIREYHEVRHAFCNRHRHEEIEEKYRTGQPAPITRAEAIREIKKLRR